MRYLLKNGICCTKSLPIGGSLSWLLSSLQLCCGFICLARAVRIRDLNS